MFEFKVLVITPVKHIKGVPEILESFASVDYLDDPSLDEVCKVVAPYDAIYVNPNKSKVYLGKEVIDAAKNLKVICTASTGTNHIDKVYLKNKGIPYLSLTEERDVIERISSTAELAFTITMAALRNILSATESVKKGEWNYEPFIGRQMNCLTIAVIGYGRLGTMYANYAAAFGSKVLIYDPYKKVEDERLEQLDDFSEVLSRSDIVALHVHVNEETTGMINAKAFSHMKKDVLIVNTSRGEIVNEADAVEFLKKNPEAKIATDVLEDEIKDRLNSALLNFAKQSEQVLITPHIGGMCREAQEIAYGHAASRLKKFATSH